MTDYPRDMRGYGAHPPAANWPNGARTAVQFVINYEEGGENCVLHGDAQSEAFLSEIVGAQPIPEQRHMNMYGSRAGFWRLHRLFTSRGMPVTVFGVAMALERNPEAVAAMRAAGWEIATHGYRWIDYQHVDETTERAHLQKALAVHERVTGERPLGRLMRRNSWCPIHWTRMTCALRLRRDSIPASSSTGTSRTRSGPCMPRAGA